MLRPKLQVGRRVTARLGLSVLLLMGCSSGEDNSASTTFCKTMESRLRECELIGSGRFGACVDYGDKAEVCETRCLREASCSALGFYFCGSTGDNAIWKCFRGCSGVEPSKCSDGKEYGPFERCDGTADCPGGEDEADCATFEPEYKCRNVSESVRQDQYCDGNRDCGDGSDEPSDCAPAGTCGDGTEYPVWSSCNGQAECPDGADESADCVISTCPTQ